MAFRQNSLLLVKSAITLTDGLVLSFLSEKFVTINLCVFCSVYPNFNNAK